MSRLTNKECCGYEDFVFSLRNKLITCSEINNSIYKKLKSLENIEEELGIDLILSLNICKKANSQKYVYMRERYGVSKLTFLNDLDVELFNHRLYANSWGVWVSLDLKEYGKEWALTRKELEDGKE